MQDTRQVFQVWHKLSSELTSMWTFKMYFRNTKTTNEPTASNNKLDRPQLNIWENWKTLKYLNINDFIHLKLSTAVFSFYIFTFLMFRKLNKPQLTENKQQHFIVIRAFDSRLYLDIPRSFKWIKSFIFRYFKVFQFSQMFNCGLSNLLFESTDDDKMLLFIFC
jgi:hypothetical protein